MVQEGPINLDELVAFHFALCAKEDHAFETNDDRRMVQVATLSAKRTCVLCGGCWLLHCMGNPVVVPCNRLHLWPWLWVGRLVHLVYSNRKTTGHLTDRVTLWSLVATSFAGGSGGITHSKIVLELTKTRQITSFVTVSLYI